MGSRYGVRLVASFAAVGAAGALLTALLVNIAFGGLLSGYLSEQQQSREQQLVTLLADSYARNGEWRTADLNALAPSVAMNGAEVKVENTAGDVIWDSGTSTAGMGGMMGGGMMHGAVLGPAQRIPITVDDAVVGTAVMQLPSAGSLSVNLAFRDAVTRVLVLGGVGAGLIAILLGAVFARRATVPVRELTRAAERLAAGNRAVRVEHRSDDEFGAMANAFNSMADAMAEEDQLRRSFAADVAHELRTPLMILGSHLEAIEDGVIPLGPDAIRSLQEEAQRMSRLVSDLEVLASADAARFTLERRKTDLGDEARAEVAEFSPLFEEKRIQVAMDVDRAPVEADPTRLRQIVGNLLSNALKFTPSGGTVRLSVHRQGSRAVLQVADSGPGISREEIGQIFDRFFRGHGMRAAGSGIGLTVVRELARAHGGDVTARNGDAGGAVFTIELPLVEPLAPSPAGGVILNPIREEGSRAEPPRSLRVPPAPTSAAARWRRDTRSTTNRSAR